MDHSAVIISVVAVTLLLSVYSLSSMFLFVEGVIVGGISCSPQGGGKTYCCASVTDKDNVYVNTTYCTTCDDTNPPSNCTPREKPKAVVNPGSDLSNILEGGLQKGGVLEEPKITPKLDNNVVPKSGGVIEEPNTAPEQNNNVFQKNEGLFKDQTENTFSKANITAPD